MVNGQYILYFGFESGFILRKKKRLFIFFFIYIMGTDTFFCIANIETENYKMLNFWKWILEYELQRTEL